ncbi:MAG: hypothetical protein M1820_005004 [Bogoriella megaspora]|nr:MAG: hypothetical protein M1820_005004 [Bogoriella megaspora]
MGIRFNEDVLEKSPENYMRMNGCGQYATVATTSTHPVPNGAHIVLLCNYITTDPMAP